MASKNEASAVALDIPGVEKATIFVGKAINALTNTALEAKAQIRTLEEAEISGGNGDIIKECISNVKKTVDSYSLQAEKLKQTLNGLIDRVKDLAAEKPELMDCYERLKQRVDDNNFEE